MELLLKKLLEIPEAASLAEAVEKGRLSRRGDRSLLGA